ncbi:hypothetical protein TYRP_005956 [Tyrophagus putrescentiae]|nr:hypothetical protein TYRP_005956 [Tyrophagus putrescentiae]
MTPHLREEMELPEIGEILLVTAIPDKLYYFGQSLDGARVGMFPKHFLRPHSTNSSTSSPIPSSNLPPPTIPPPSPPHISINFGKHLSVDFADGQGNRLPRTPVDTPPSYEAAICCEPVSYGYATQMFSEIESYGRVLFNFDAQDENELTLRESQIVRLFRHVDDGWMEGELDGKVGLFPKSYIDIIVDCEANAPADFVADSSTGGGANSNCQNQVVAIDYPPNTRARVLYDFDPEMEQDLRVRAGETIVLLKHFTTTDWVEACNASGTVGFIHLNFCEMLSSVPHHTITTASNRVIEHKPHRPAPRAPRRTNIFPTFNQFLMNEKQDIEQFEIGPGPSGGGGGGGASAPSNQASSGEPQKGTSVQSLASNKRQCVITELIQTERDYCHAMNVCLNVFRGKSAEAERCGVDTEKLFGTMKTVVDVSKSLLKLLDNYANNRPFVDQRVGICFLDLKFELRDAFVSYCKSHDSTSMLLRFYEADSKSSDFMRRCQTEIQRQTNCFDLASIVIKPVQRILKYPLLINELSKCTEEGHTDWEPLQRAMEMLTDIAQSINENKRRQDLIQKYCKSSDTSFSSRLKSLNAHTVKKKGSRIANRIISTLTFSSVHNDENYDAVFHKFQGVDKAIRSFVKCIQAYLNSLNEYYHQSLAVANSMLEYYGSKKEVEDLRTTHHEIYTKYFADFRAVVERDVVNLLYKLTDKFKGYYQDIEEAFRVKHNLVFSQMLHDFSLIHSSAFPNSANGPHAADGGCSSTLTGTLSRLHIHRSSTSSNTWKNSLPARKTSQGGGTSDNDKKVQDSSQKRKLIKSYRQDDLFIVRQTYTPCDVLDLYAQQEDIVGVIKRKDPSGQDHRWYVDRGEMKGFLPQAILAPYQKQQNASLFQTQHSASDNLLPLPSYENVDLLTADHRYDSVPEEEALILTPPSTQPPSTTSDAVYHAAYPFKAGDQNQLSLEFGQRVLVKAKCDLQGNGEWWLVRSALGKEGYVPANYLRKN